MLLKSGATAQASGLSFRFLCLTIRKTGQRTNNLYYFSLLALNTKILGKKSQSDIRNPVKHLWWSFFPEIDDSLYSCAHLAKFSIIDLWQDAKYASSFAHKPPFPAETQENPNEMKNLEQTNFICQRAFTNNSFLVTIIGWSNAFRKRETERERERERENWPKNEIFHPGLYLIDVKKITVSRKFIEDILKEKRDLFWIELTMIL